MPTLTRTIVTPIVTEQTSAAYQDRGEYTFEVHPEATKPQIRTAIEDLFGVKVTDVWTMPWAYYHGLEATLAQKLEGESRGERFTLIRGSNEPDEPVFPNRLGMILIGLVLGGGIALGRCARLPPDR